MIHSHINLAFHYLGAYIIRQLDSVQSSSIFYTILRRNCFTQTTTLHAALQSAFSSSQLLKQTSRRPTCQKRGNARDLPPVLCLNSSPAPADEPMLFTTVHATSI